MDLIRAQHLLLKIQAFLENGNGEHLSRLEKDLVKSYIIQLYDAMSAEDTAKHNEVVKAPEMPVQKTIYPEAPPVYATKMVTPEPEKKVTFEMDIKEVQDVAPEIKTTVIEPVIPIVTPEPKPLHVPVAETMHKVAHQPEVSPIPKEFTEELSRLFELPNADDVSGRFSHVPIANIESALGLNERIFTLNELFGGNRGLFDTTCAELNALQSYADAKTLLMGGPARQFNWTDPERIKMAEHFVRIVARRYPKS